MSSAWIDVDIGAIAHNVRTLLATADGAELCGVVKANGYGHGAALAAEGCVDGGATRLAVAQVNEGIELREAGFDLPIWVLSEPEPGEWELAATHRLEPAVYSDRGIVAASAAAAAARSAGAPLTVHLLADTGMNRSGVRWTDAADVAIRIDRDPWLRLGSVWTHLATADEPGNPYTDRQLDRYDEALEAVERAGVDVPLRHAANSAGAIGVSRARYDLVRPGIAVYGIAPSHAMAGMADLRPALRLATTVAYAKKIDPEDLVGYGATGSVTRPSWVATVPVGYADGVRRSWTVLGGRALIGGRPRRLLGRVSMDQIVLDCGDDEIAPGDEVVFIGRQGDAEITAEDVDDDLGTIGYEVVCDLGRRVERRPKRPG